ncbi:MAG TPA: carbon-nitrogen hydrolase family protein [Chryseosolibacter sp.]
MENKKSRQVTGQLAWTAVFAFLIVSSLSLPSQGQDAGWKFESQRQEIAPLSGVDNDVTFDGKPTLRLAGNGKDYASGCWFKIADAEAGQYYEFRTHYKSTKVDEPARSILARVIWQDASGEIVGFREYPATLPDKDKNGWRVIEQSYLAPAGARTARIELSYRWDGDGAVNFGATSFDKTAPPQPRMVRLATINHRPRNSRSAGENLAAFAALVDQAGKQKADIVCLPEGTTIVGTQEDYISGSEPVPGPTTKYLGEVAKRNHLYIVAGLLEKEGDVVYNTAVLIDRNGHLAGRYRKTSLPREEIDGGVTPGSSFPVFETDFGRVGIMICWDVTFPEPARALAQQGAEVIFLPIWGGDLTLAKARAIENQVYLVSSTYDMISAIFDLEGNVLKQAKEDKSVAVVEVDLNQQKLWPWLGDLKNRIPREMPSRQAIQSGASVASGHY